MDLQVCGWRGGGGGGGDGWGGVLMCIQYPFGLPVCIPALGYFGTSPT